MCSRKSGELWIAYKKQIEINERMIADFGSSAGESLEPLSPADLMD